MAEKVEPNTFRPPCHKLRKDIETKLTELLKEYELQFTHDETTIGTTPLTKMTIDTRVSEPVSLKPYPIVMKHYKWVKDKINKLPTENVIRGNQPSWSAPIIVVPKEDGGKYLVIDSMHSTNHVKIYLAYAKGRRHFFPTYWYKIFLNPGSMSRISPHPIG